MPTKLTRREFVSTSTAAGLALGAAPRCSARRRPCAPARRPRWSSPRTTATSSRTAAPKTGVAAGLRDDDQRRQGRARLRSSPASTCASSIPTEAGVGYGGLPNADGVVQLDSCCMHGPAKRAGGVAALEGVRDAVAGRQGGDGDDRPSSAGRQGRAGLRPQHGLHDRGRPQHREVARAVARVEAADRPRALPRPEEARARRADGRPGDGARRPHRPATTTGAPSTATASTPRARCAA